MKKNVLVLVFATLLIDHQLTQAQNPIPNYSFETWIGDSPEGWQTGNSVAQFITKESPGHSGSFAAKGEVKNVVGVDYPPILASLDITGEGFPVTQGYTTLYFYYKFTQVGSANLFVTINYYNNDGSDAGYGVGTFGPAANYTLGTVNANITGNPVECIITFSIFDLGGLAAVGNYFVVDDVSFDNQVGVSPVADYSYNLDSPLPSLIENYTTVSFTVPYSAAIDFKICDITGKELKLLHQEQVKQGRNSLMIDVGDLNNGAYFIVMSSSFGTIARKITISR